MFKNKSLHNGTHRCGIVEFSYFLLMIMRLEKTKQKPFQLNKHNPNNNFQCHTQNNFIFPSHPKCLQSTLILNYATQNVGKALVFSSVCSYTFNYNLPFWCSLNCIMVRRNYRF